MLTRRYALVTWILFWLMIPGIAHAGEAADLFAKAAPSSQESIDHSIWDRLLKTYVKPGRDGINRVDYWSFKALDHATLKDYIAALQKVDPSSLERPEQFAFLANLYNAKTVDIVLDHYPVKSIKDISLGGGLLASFTGGPWKAKVVKLKGIEFSLDDIEHAILRRVFKDPRVHYAVNCASLGCPNLMPEAFTGAKLNAQLDAGAKAYINHPRGVDIQSGRVTTSSIYNWFKEDFGGSDEGVLQHIRRYAEPDLAAKLTGVSSIDDYTYDWRLNDTRP